MEIVDKIPNLRTSLENKKKELEMYEYYKKITDEDWQIINRRNEYCIVFNCAMKIFLDVI